MRRKCLSESLEKRGETHGLIKIHWRENGQNVRTGKRTENLKDDNKIRDAIWAEDFNEYKFFFAGNSKQTKKGK